MKIEEIKSKNIGSIENINCVVSNNQTLVAKNSNEYVALTITDKTGKLTINIFDDIEKFKDFKVGDAILVRGAVSEWNGVRSLKNISARHLNVTEYKREDFIDCYYKKSNLETLLLETINNMTEPWKSITMRALELDTEDKKVFKEFMECPSAEKMHGNKIHGLFYHTIGMLITASNVFKTYNKEGAISIYKGSLSDYIDKDRIYCKIILHDLEKIHEYEYNTFVRKIPNVLGHIQDGVCMIDRVNSELDNILTREQLEDFKYSILSHHGQYGNYTPKTFDDTFLHLLDMIDSRVVGLIDGENNNEK